jgi:2-polyprenyl-3-methyl-5-hydroxy-6-metoxy-1,4-benzoquinol methylase
MEYSKIVDLKRLNYISRVLKENLPEGAVVLDVGCGNGIISRSLGRLGFTVKGIDVSDKAIANAIALNTLPNVSFEVKSAEQLVADGSKFHAIVCSEVIEHLYEPSILLKTIHQVLEPNGVLIVTVPNGRGPRELLVTRPVIHLQKKNNWIWKALNKFKSLLGYKGTTVQSAADDLTHVQFFTKKSLHQLANQNNFKIIHFGNTNFIEDVFPFSFLTKRIKVLQKIDCAIADVLPHQFTGGFVTTWKSN